MFLQINPEERLLAELDREMAKFDPWETFGLADMDMDTTNVRSNARN